MLDVVYRDIADIVYLLDVLVVIVYISHCNCWIYYLLLHEDWGECSEGWAGAWWWWWGGGGGGGSFYELKLFFSQTNVLGVLKLLGGGGGGGEKFPSFFWWDFGVLGAPHAPTRGSRAGSENDTLLPMTMTRDRTKFWSGPPWRRMNKKTRKTKK